MMKMVINILIKTMYILYFIYIIVIVGSTTACILTFDVNENNKGFQIFNFYLY